MLRRRRRAVADCRPVRVARAGTTPAAAATPRRRRPRRGWKRDRWMCRAARSTRGQPLPPTRRSRGPRPSAGRSGRRHRPAPRPRDTAPDRQHPTPRSETWGPPALTVRATPPTATAAPQRTPPRRSSRAPNSARARGTDPGTCWPPAAPGPQPPAATAAGGAGQGEHAHRSRSHRMRRPRKAGPPATTTHRAVRRYTSPSSPAASPYRWRGSSETG